MAVNTPAAEPVAATFESARISSSQSSEKPGQRRDAAISAIATKLHFISSTIIARVGLRSHRGMASHSPSREMTQSRSWGLNRPA
jgi:hypothetical protein